MSGSCSSRGVVESDAGGMSATVASMNTADCCGPAVNCNVGSLPLWCGFRELHLTSFDESDEDERDTKGDCTGASDISMPAKLSASICCTTVDLTTDYTRSRHTSTDFYSLREDVAQRWDKNASGADAAATPEAEMTPSSLASFASTLLLFDQPHEGESCPTVMRYETSPTRQRIRKRLPYVDLTCAGPKPCIVSTAALSPSSLLSSSVVGAEYLNTTSNGDRNGGRSMCLVPQHPCGDSDCSLHEYWTMTPSLCGVNHVLMEGAPGSSTLASFHQALVALQVWGSPLSLELHGNSAGGTYMVRLAKSLPSPAAGTLSTTGDDSVGAVVAVFKPCDEEIGQKNNPHGNHESNRADVFSPGSGSRREVLAYRLDHGHNAGVPPTVEVVSTYWGSSVNGIANRVGEDGVPVVSLAAGTVRSMPGKGSVSNSGGLHDQRTCTTMWRGPGTADVESTQTQAAAAAVSIHSQMGSLQLFVPDCQEAADILPGHFNADEVHALAIFDIRTLNGDRHGGNVLVSNFHRRYAKRTFGIGRRPLCDGLTAATETCGVALPASASPTEAPPSSEMFAPVSVVRDSAPHLIPIDHSYICPSGYADPDYEWLSWPQSKVPFSAHNLAYIAGLDAVADAELVRTALLAPSGVDLYDTSLLRRSAACGDLTISKGRPEAVLASLVLEGAPFAYAVEPGSAAMCFPVAEGDASPAHRTHCPPQRGGCPVASALMPTAHRMLSPAQTLRAGTTVEAAATITTSAPAAAPPSESVGATTGKSTVTTATGSCTEASCSLPPRQVSGALISELPMNAERVGDLKKEEMHQGLSSVRTDAIASAWLTSSSSSSSSFASQFLRTGPRQVVPAPVIYDRDAANTAAELIRCTTRLLQIAALEFHMTAYEIGSLCRRPRIAQASVLEEVLEEARDYVTWEPVWSKFDDVVRQRLARHDRSSR